MNVALQCLMATDATYERHMVGSRRMLDLGQLQDSFQVLLSQAHPDHVAAFFYWLDLKVAQFKVFGSCLSQGTTGYYMTVMRVALVVR